MHVGTNNDGVNLHAMADTAIDADECCSRCVAEAACVGYTYRLDNNECWLKSAVADYRADSLTTSGTVSAPSEQCDTHEGMNNDGVNIYAKADAVTSADECCSRCIAEDGCVGFTYRHDNKECWLKSAVE